MNKQEDLFDVIIAIWYYLGSCLFLYVIMLMLRWPTAWAFAIGSLCWLVAALITFQRRKPDPRYFLGRLDYPPLKPDQDVPASRRMGCLRCVHLTQNIHRPDPYTIVYGICNYDSVEISNTGYPWNCQKFYSGNNE